MFSSRLILPYVETIVEGSNIALLPVLTRSKCVLLPKVAGGGLVVVDDEHPPPHVLGLLLVIGGDEIVLLPELRSSACTSRSRRHVTVCCS